MYKKSGYSNGYTKFNSAKTFKKTTTGTYKTKAFTHKPHYKHRRSTNSATTGVGRYFKTVQMIDVPVQNFVKVVNQKAYTGFLVFSTHLPLVAGPLPHQPQKAGGYLIQTPQQKQIAFLKVFQNVYLSKIKIAPIINYGSTVKYKFFKNNVPLTSTESGLSYDQCKIVNKTQVDTSTLLISGPNQMRSYVNKSKFSPDWLFLVKDGALTPLNTTYKQLAWQNSIFLQVLMTSNSSANETVTLRVQYSYVCYGQRTSSVVGAQLEKFRSQNKMEEQQDEEDNVERKVRRMKLN